MAYKKPTLKETLCELHLGTGNLSESRFFDVVPQLKILGFDDVEFATVGLSLEIKQGRPSPRERQQVRCWKPGRTELVQVGEDLLVVNLMGEYPGWDAFVRLFDQGRRALEAGLGTIEIRSLNLITVDSFQVPKEGFSISHYLDVGGQVIPKWYAGCTESFDLDMGRGLLEPDGHNRQVHVNVRAANDPVNVAFRTLVHDRVQAGADLGVLMTRLHEESKATFESLVTDRVRNEVMGGRAQ